MAPASVAAHKITPNSRLPRGLADDPPPSPTLNPASLSGNSSRRKSRPPPAAPARSHSSYNFKATHPPGTSLLTAVEPLLAPQAISPTPPGIPPGTPLLHAAATGLTPPMPLNLDLAEIAQPVPVRPNLREGTSYCSSILSPLPTIEELQELKTALEGEETDNDDWHSIRSHMTRITTFGANSILYNMSMATPNMPLPTPEELKAAYEEKQRMRNAYLQGLSRPARTHSTDSSVGNGAVAGSSTPASGILSRIGLFTTKSAAYPFPDAKVDRKGKGKAVENGGSPVEKAGSSKWADLFKSNAQKEKEREARRAEEAARYQADALQRMEDGFGDPPVNLRSLNGLAQHEPSEAGPYRSPYVEDESRTSGEEQPRIQLVDGADPFHDNFATSDSNSPIPSLSSSTINFLQNGDGSYQHIKGAPAWHFKGKSKRMADPPIENLGLPAPCPAPKGKLPASSPALASGSAFREKFTGPPAETMGPDGEPAVRRELSHEEPKAMSDSSSSEEEEAPHPGTKVNRATRFMRPGLNSRVSTVRDERVRRASTVEIVRSGATESRVVIQESRNSHSSMEESEYEQMQREARLKKLTSRRLSLGMGRRRKSSVFTQAQKQARRRNRSMDENGVRRRISTALQGGFGGRKMTTDGRGGIGSAADMPARERQGIFANILDKFRRGSENEAIAEKKRGKRPAMGSGDGADGVPMRKKTSSFWRRRIEPDENGKVPMLKRMQEAIKRGNSSAMPAPA